MQTTARKGRRSKSRDVLKDSAPTTASVTSNSSGQFASSNNPDLSIDITLEQQEQKQQTASTSNNISTAQSGASFAGGSGDISSILNSSSDSKRPPALRRISGGWADSAVGNKLK